MIQEKVCKKQNEVESEEEDEDKGKQNMKKNKNWGKEEERGKSGDDRWRARRIREWVVKEKIREAVGKEKLAEKGEAVGKELDEKRWRGWRGRK